MNQLKKYECIIFIGKNSKILQTLCKNKKIKLMLIDKDIHNLEKEIKQNKNLIAYPLNTQKLKENSQIILKNITKKNFKTIKSIIIYTQEPHYAKPLENLESKEWIESFNENIHLTINIIKQIINFFSNINTSIIFILHREKIQKNKFFCLNQSINQILIKIMTTLNENNSNIKINCISTENITLNYKKHIYPYKNKKSLKEIIKLTNACSFITKKNIRNKIIII